jgi:16S rRNA A1518/A1519 N6-dimethyltransferase RsmA/KsgA/DIM1 with predicted DNA glycosylase/AP lyase activity
VLPEADLSLDQHFLTSPAKLDTLLAAAGIRPGDEVVEFGAGAGTVAARVPACRSLTLVEYDPRLVAHLTPRFPRATVRQGDALDLVHALRFDVLLSNLPWQVTADLIPHLARVPFRTAVLAVDPVLDLDALTGDSGDFDGEHLAVLDGPDFTPPQDVPSHLIRLSPRTTARAIAG